MVLVPDSQPDVYMIQPCLFLYVLFVSFLFFYIFHIIFLNNRYSRGKNRVCCKRWL